MRKSTSVLLAAAVVWGCSGGDDATGPTGTSTSRVSLGIVSSGNGGASAALASLAGDEGTLFGNGAEEAVGAINLQLSYVEVLPSTGGGWVQVDPPSGPMAVNMLGLPGESDPPMLLARGDLESGEYTQARIFFSDLELVLDEAVCFGGDTCFEAGVYTNVIVPSSEPSGIKTDVHFTIEEGSVETEVTLVFDPDATVKNITYSPGRDLFILAPVFRGPAEVNDGEGS